MSECGRTGRLRSWWPRRLVTRPLSLCCCGMAWPDRTRAPPSPICATPLRLPAGRSPPTRSPVCTSCSGPFPTKMAPTIRHRSCSIWPGASSARSCATISPCHVEFGCCRYLRRWRRTWTSSVEPHGLLDLTPDTHFRDLVISMEIV